MISAIRKQVDAFCDGFDSLIPHEKIRMFTPTELCLLICGVPKIDVDDLRNNVVIEEPYDANSPVINLFFNTIKKWDDENLAKLLIFITGTARMPSNGFVYYNQIRKPITIQAGGDHTRLPVAHTCVNTLDLPEYQNEEEMNSKLLLAIKVQDFQVK